MATPFAGEAHQTGAPDPQALPEQVEEVVGNGSDAYKLVKSPTGHNYVQANDYDPLGDHRPKARAEGLGFMCCCAPRVKEPGMDRHYSIDPATQGSVPN